VSIVLVENDGILHSSTSLVGPLPPIANAPVAVPARDIPPLAVFKSLTSTQLVPFQSSVLAVNGADSGVPPKAIAELLTLPLLNFVLLRLDY